MTRRTRHRNQRRLDKLLATYRDHATNRPFICRACAGPCPRYGGPHGWLCEHCTPKAGDRP